MSNNSTPIMSPSQSPSSTRLDVKIRYYIHRTNSNTIVPLIPADQLPFQLKDFPQNLSHRQLSEGGWKFLDETAEVPFPLPLLTPYIPSPIDERPHRGTVDDQKLTDEVLTTDCYLDIVSARPKLLDGELKKGGVISELPALVTGDVNTGTKDLSANATDNMSIGRIKSLTDSMAAIYAQDARRLGYTKSAQATKKPGVAKERDFCRRWIKTGECVHATKGCWYKHEMPSVRKLKDLGIGGIPQWYQETTRVMQKRSLSKSLTKNAAIDKTNRSIKQVRDMQSPVTLDSNHAAEHGTYTTNTINEPMLMDMNDMKPRFENSSDHVHTFTLPPTSMLSKVSSTSLEQPGNTTSSSPSSTYTAQSAFIGDNSHTPVNNSISIGATALTTSTSQRGVPASVHAETSPLPLPNTSISGSGAESNSSQSPPLPRRAISVRPDTPPESPSPALKPPFGPTEVPATQESTKIQTDPIVQNPSTRVPDGDAAKLAKVFSKGKVVSKQYKKRACQTVLRDTVRKVSEKEETGEAVAVPECNVGGLVRVQGERSEPQKIRSKQLRDVQGWIHTGIM